MLLGNKSRQAHAYVYGAITHSGAAFQRTSTSHVLSNCPHRRQTMERQVPQPHNRNPCRVSHDHGLASSDFARHYSRNHFCFLFLRVLRCFTSPRSPLTPYFIQMQVTAHNCGWVPPFGHPRINARLPTPQGLSQAPTSFIGSRCQGIHHAPCPACPHKHPTPHNNTNTATTATTAGALHARGDQCDHTPDTTQNPARTTINAQPGPTTIHASRKLHKITQKTHSKHYTPTTQHETNPHGQPERVVMLASTIQIPNNQLKPTDQASSKRPTSAVPLTGPTGLMSQGPTVCSRARKLMHPTDLPAS